MSEMILFYGHAAPMSLFVHVVEVIVMLPVCLRCKLSNTPLVSLQMLCPTNDRQTHGSVN